MRDDYWTLTERGSWSDSFMGCAASRREGGAHPAIWDVSISLQPEYEEVIIFGVVGILWGFVLWVWAKEGGEGVGFNCGFP